MVANDDLGKTSREGKTCMEESSLLGAQVGSSIPESLGDKWERSECRESLG